MLYPILPLKLRCFAHRAFPKENTTKTQSTSTSEVLPVNDNVVYRYILLQYLESYNIVFIPFF